MERQVPTAWAGIDVGKGHHWLCLIDESGTTLWSTKVVNDETAILDAIAGVLARAEEVVWGVDVTGTMSGLLLALSAAHGQRVRYVPGRTVNQMAGAYRGEAKTDAKDAYVIAETLRHRGDLAPVEVATSLVTELRLLVTHRTDLVGDRVRMVNRLRDVLSGYFPALERAFDYAHSRGALVLLTGYQTPAAIRRVGESRLRTWLVKRKVRSAEQVATAALSAAQAQHTVVPGQDVTASIVVDLATQLLAIGTRIAELDARITTTFRAHPQAEIIESLPGHGSDPGRRADRREWGPGRLRERRPTRLGRRARPRPTRLRAAHRQPAPPDALLPQAAQSVLPLHPVRDDARGTQPRLLPQEAWPRARTRPSPHRARPPPSRRPMGTAPRQPALRAPVTRPTIGRFDGLTKSLRIHR